MCKMTYYNYDKKNYYARNCFKSNKDIPKD